MKTLFALMFMMTAALSLSPAKAQIQVTPGVGVPLLGDYEYASGSGGSLWGLSFSSQIGYRMANFSAGFDAAIRDLAADSDDFALSDNQFFTREYGVYFSYHWGNSWRGWFTPLLEVDADDRVGNDFSGAGYRFGVSRFINEIFALQLEFVSHKYGDFKDGGDGSSQQLDQTLRHEFFLLSLTMPFELDPSTWFSADSAL